MTETAAGTPDYGSVVLGPLSSHTTARPPAASTSLESQSTADGRHFESQATRDLRRYGSPAAPRWILNQARRVLVDDHAIFSSTPVPVTARNRRSVRPAVSAAETARSAPIRCGLADRHFGTPA